MFLFVFTEDYSFHFVVKTCVLIKNNILIKSKNNRLYLPGKKIINLYTFVSILFAFNLHRSMRNYFVFIFQINIFFNKEVYLFFIF